MKIDEAIPTRCLVNVLINVSVVTILIMQGVK